MPLEYILGLWGIPALCTVAVLSFINGRAYWCSLVPLCLSPFVQCPDCSFISSSQGNLGIHRSKMHKCTVPENINSVNIVRLFPEGKSHYCCLCSNIIGSFPNFKRHFSTSHKGIILNVSAKCVICDREFPTSNGAGVHIKRTHNIGKDQIFPLSPLPVMSFVDYTLSQNSSTLVSSLRPRRSSRISLVNSPLSGINTRPSTCITSPTVAHDMCDSQVVNTSFSQPPPQIPPCPIASLTSSPLLAPRSLTNLHRSDTPPPILSDVDPDDLDVLPPSPSPTFPFLISCPGWIS